MHSANAGPFVGTLLMISCIVGGCEHDVDKLPQNNGTTITFEAVSSQVFEPNCATCHQNGASSGGLDLSAPENIVNEPSTQKPQMSLIKPNSPQDSYLYLKITGDESITGSSMPPGATLSQQKIELVATWINDGAPGNIAAKGTIFSADRTFTSQR